MKDLTQKIRSTLHRFFYSFSLVWKSTPFLLIILILIAILFTILVKVIDVKQVGINQTTIGFASITFGVQPKDRRLTLSKKQRTSSLHTSSSSVEKRQVQNAP